MTPVEESDRESSFPLYMARIAPKLSQAGFYYAGNIWKPDNATCAFCQVSLNNWCPNECIIKRHRESSPLCPFILSSNIDNLTVDQLDFRTPDICDDDDLPAISTEYSNKEFYFKHILYAFFEISRKETFVNHRSLIKFAEKGLYIIEKFGESYLKCCFCGKELEILDLVANLDEKCFHSKGCPLMDYEEHVIRHKQNLFIEYPIDGENLAVVAELQNILHIITGIFSITKNKTDLSSLSSPTKEVIPDKITDFSVILHKKCAGNCSSFASVIYLPCGHLEYCKPCSTTFKYCPRCDREIERFETDWKLQSPTLCYTFDT